MSIRSHQHFLHGTALWMHLRLVVVYVLFFGNIILLIWFILVVEGPGMFPCETCGRSYSHKRTLLTHLRLECGKAPQFACQLCNYRAKRKGSLQSHMVFRHRNSDATFFKDTWPRYEYCSSGWMFTIIFFIHFNMH